MLTISRSEQPVSPIPPQRDLWMSKAILQYPLNFKFTKCSAGLIQGKLKKIGEGKFPLPSTVFYAKKVKLKKQRKKKRSDFSDY